jgi:hypothetical protein
VNVHWRPVVGYEGMYEVSDKGDVRSLNRTVQSRDGRMIPIPGVMLTRVPDERGRLSVTLSRDGLGRPRRIHLLVLEAFVGPRPDGMKGCHNNGDHTNNHISNLRWDTQSNNVFDSVHHGTHPAARKTKCKWGHDFTPENTYWETDRKRSCRKCNNRRTKECAERRVKGHAA